MQILLQVVALLQRRLKQGGVCWDMMHVQRPLVLAVAVRQGVTARSVLGREIMPR